MNEFVKMEQVPLKNNSNITEAMIQKFIFENPSVLGLGELTAIQREKLQPSGGRIDMLLADDSKNRYEVEIQLGATDPSHIIRTIEYWDTERKRYPQYDHCAVIVAEEITSRFMNVISLFNGTIPLIAIQVSAFKNGKDISLVFTKVLDRITLGDEDEPLEVTDRNYWENRSTVKMLKFVDMIHKDLGSLVSGYELKYNKFYIGLAKDGIVRNFVNFKPKKSFMWLSIKGNEDAQITKAIENAGLDMNYDVGWKRYNIKLNNFDEYKANKELIDSMIKNALEYFNID